MMDRNRDGRRVAASATNMVTTSTNGLSSKRRHRSSSLRDSPDEDGGVELQESIRLRERVKKEKDRDRERDKERDRERERERERERSSRSKRRRAERLLMHNTNGGGGGGGGGLDDNTSEESVNDEEEDYEDEEMNNNNSNSNTLNHYNSNSNSGVRLLPPSAVGSNNHLHHRKNFSPNTPSTKIYGPAPVWKSGDEMIGVSVPRKARSAATKRSHDWISSNNGSGGGNCVEQNHRQTSASPVRQVPAPATAPPMSPSSSNVSVRKKLKPSSNGLKPRPPKSMTKSSSSNPEELEIEIAEVLYGLMTQSGPSKKEIASNDSKEANNKSNIEAISQVSGSHITQPSSFLPQNSTSSAAPLSVVAPKRKRPRQVSDNLGTSTVRSSPISSTKAEMEQTMKMEISTTTSSPSLTPGSAPVENGAVSYHLGSLVNSQGQPEQPPEIMKVDSETKLPVAEELAESKDLKINTFPPKESPVVRPEEHAREDLATGVVSCSAKKANSAVAEVESPKEEKFQIDLMAPPPQSRSSLEREVEIDLGAAVEDQKPSVSRIDAVMRSEMEKNREEETVGKDAMVNVGAEDKKAKSALEEAESHKAVENKEVSINLQLDLEKPDRDITNKQQQPPAAVKVTKEDPHAEKTGQCGLLHLPMSMASWPGGLPPMGYMAPLQGVVSMDGSTVPSAAPVQMPLFSQPRKRCATHCHVARNIHYLQQFSKMNPFWNAAAGSASLFGSKPPSVHVQGNIARQGVNNVQDKGHGLAISPDHGGKDNRSSQPANTADADAVQRKQQILMQQAMPSMPPNNMMHGPAFIFPLNQQQAAMAAASAQPGSARPSTIMAGAASTNASNSASSSSATAAGGVAPAMSFSYPNMPANETQYLAILQNNGYPFPIPGVGGPPSYGRQHPQAMPLFNGSFYSSQIIHPSQLQQQPPPASQSHQVQQSQQNMSMSGVSSSTQKHLQSQQLRPPQNSAGQNRTSQQSQTSTNQHIPQPLVRQLENEAGGEDSPSTADSRGSRAPMNIYGQNFAMAMHPPNFALITPPATSAGASTASGNNHHSDKKHHQQGPKSGVESMSPQAFAMSFGPISGATTPSIDLSSMAQNHAMFQNFQDANRQKMQMIAAASAAQVAQQKKNNRISEDGRLGVGDSTSNDDERKSLAVKASATSGQSIAFARTEFADVAGSAIPGNNVIESSARASRSSVPNTVGAIGVQNAQLHAQMQHQQQQFMQFHKQQQQRQLQQQQQHQQHQQQHQHQHQQQHQQQQHQHQQQQQQQQQQQHQHQQQQQQQQFVAAMAARSKTTVTSNESVYPEHLAASSSIAAKFPSAFPQNLVQNSNSSSPAQSPQWKNSARPITSQSPSSLASSTTSSLKNLQQQPARTPQSHTQISFGSNQKSSAGSQGQQQPPARNQSPSPPMTVGSPTSSISKGASGSPRMTTSASTSSKTGQASSLSTQHPKHSPQNPSQRSSPVGNRNVPSILGNPHVASIPSSGSKPQMQQQAQLFFSNPYAQAQSPHSTNTNSTASATSGYYLQRRRPDQQQTAPQQPPGSSATSLSDASTNDPAKAIAAAAASNMKNGGGFPTQGIFHSAQFASQQSSGNQHPLMPAGFSYVHAVPTAVQVKPPEKKQPPGNDNLHACWQPEKK